MLFQRSAPTLPVRQNQAVPIIAFRNLGQIPIRGRLARQNVASAGTGMSTVSAKPTGPSAIPTPSVVPAPSTTGKDVPFHWTSHWYPVAIVADLDPHRPHSIHLLGTALALWRDGQSVWRAVEDKCAHRLAPLSEGRVESDGTLQCAYHGWQFDGRGACTHIPQLRGDDKAQQVACASRRSCVRAFPATVAHGLLWVLPDSSAEGWDKTAMAPTTSELLGGVMPDGSDPVVSWFVRDMPFRYDTLVENLTDPSHVPFTHHGVQGRRSSEKGTKLHIQELSQSGFSAQYNMTGNDSVVSFQAPATIRYISGGVPNMLLLAVPTRPGWSRLCHGIIQNTNTKRPLLLSIMFQTLMSNPWLDHAFFRHATLDGDSYFLTVQERLLLQQGNDWRTAYYMPAPADGAVLGMRRWFDQYGGAVPTCERGTPMPLQPSKRQALDRYSQHTVHCRHCQKALRNTEVAVMVMAAAGVLSVLWLVARAVAGLPLLTPATALGLLAAAVCGGMVAALRSLRQQFFFVDYVHQDKD